MKDWITNGNWQWINSWYYDKGKSKCPKCGDGGFSYLVVRYLPTGTERNLYEVGWCNRKDTCPQPNQLLKGKELFETFEQVFDVKDDWEKSKTYPYPKQRKIITPKTFVGIYDRSYLEKHIWINPCESTFWIELKRLGRNPEHLRSIVEEYGLGRIKEYSNNLATPFFDLDGKECAGVEIKWFKPNNKTDHQLTEQWKYYNLSSFLRNGRKETRPSFVGQHLIKRYPENKRWIITESVKNAVYLVSYYLEQYNRWGVGLKGKRMPIILATTSATNLTDDRLLPLLDQYQPKEVTYFSDYDKAGDVWHKKFNQWQKTYPAIKFIDGMRWWVENYHPKPKDDIADVLTQVWGFNIPEQSVSVDPTPEPIKTKPIMDDPPPIQKVVDDLQKPNTEGFDEVQKTSQIKENKPSGTIIPEIKNHAPERTETPLQRIIVDPKCLTIKEQIEIKKEIVLDVLWTHGVDHKQAVQMIKEQTVKTEWMTDEMVFYMNYFIKEKAV